MALLDGPSSKVVEEFFNEFPESIVDLTQSGRATTRKKAIQIAKACDLEFDDNTQTNIKKSPNVSATINNTKQQQSQNKQPVIDLTPQEDVDADADGDDLLGTKDLFGEFSIQH